MSEQNNIFIKRIYSDASADDGFRILVDRLWPIGISKEKAQINLWMKEIAPSNELRKWFSHDMEKYEEFKNRYFDELENNPKIADFKNLIDEKLKEGNITLLFSAKDEEHNNAVALRDWLMK